MALSDFTVGQRVFYFLPRAPRNGRPTDVYLPATVLTVTTKRLVLRLDGHQAHRITIEKNVRLTVPTT